MELGVNEELPRHPPGATNHHTLKRRENNNTGTYSKRFIQNSKPILPSIISKESGSPEEELTKLAKLGLENRLENFIFKK